MTLKIEQKITLQQVIDQVNADKEGKHQRVVSGTNHEGWTHDFNDCKTDASIPLTRYGCLMLENKIESWLNVEEILGCESYGPHPIDTLMAMHFQNFTCPKEEVGSLLIRDFIAGVEEEIKNGTWTPTPVPETGIVLSDDFKMTMKNPLTGEESEMKGDDYTVKEMKKEEETIGVSPLLQEAMEKIAGIVNEYDINACVFLADGLTQGEFRMFYDEPTWSMIEWLKDKTGNVVGVNKKVRMKTEPENTKRTINSIYNLQGMISYVWLVTAQVKTEIEKFVTVEKDSSKIIPGKK